VGEGIQQAGAGGVDVRKDKFYIKIDIHKAQKISLLHKELRDILNNNHKIAGDLRRQAISNIDEILQIMNGEFIKQIMEGKNGLEKPDNHGADRGIA